MGPRPGLAVFTRTLLLCVVITWLVHVVTYLLNTQLPLQIVAPAASAARKVRCLRATAAGGGSIPLRHPCRTKPTSVPDNVGHSATPCSTIRRRSAGVRESPCSAVVTPARGLSRFL